MSKLPPGPWFHKDDGMICEAAPVTIYAANQTEVCAVIAQVEEPAHQPTSPETLAVARAIVALPDLLDAVTQFLDIASYLRIQADLRAAEWCGLDRLLMATIVKAKTARAKALEGSAQAAHSPAA